MSSFLTLAREDKSRWYVCLLSFILPFAVQFVAQVPIIVIFKLFFLDYTYHFTTVTLGFMIALPPFIFAFLTLVGCIKFLHKRRALSIFTNRSKFDWNRLGFVMIIYVLSMIVMAAITLMTGGAENIFWDFNAQAFIPLMIMVLLFVPLQATFEELYFRGLILQTLGKWLNAKVVIIVIQAILFMLIHLLNPITVIELMMVLAMGITFGIIAVYDDGLELAIGYHIINNIFSFLIIGRDGNSIFLDNNLPGVFELMIFISLQALMLFIFAKKYHWKFRQSK